MICHGLWCSSINRCKMLAMLQEVGSCWVVLNDVTLLGEMPTNLEVPHLNYYAVSLEMKNGFLLASLAASKTVREIANWWFRWLSGNVPYSCRWLWDTCLTSVSWLSATGSELCGDSALGNDSGWGSSRWVLSASPSDLMRVIIELGITVVRFGLLFTGFGCVCYVLQGPWLQNTDILILALWQLTAFKWFFSNWMIEFSDCSRMFFA